MSRFNFLLDTRRGQTGVILLPLYPLESLGPRPCYRAAMLPVLPFFMLLEWSLWSKDKRDGSTWTAMLVEVSAQNKKVGDTVMPAAILIATAGMI